MQKRRLLCLVPATLDAIQAKGTVDHIFYRDLEGYFEHVLTVHFPAERDRMVKLSGRHTVLEFSKQRLAALRTLPRINMLASGAHLLISLFHTIKREKISVIKAHDPYIQGLSAFFLSRATGIPFLVQIVSNYDLTYKSTGASAYPVLKFRPIEKILERSVFRHADLVMAVSENNRDFAIRNGTPLSKAITVPSSGLPSKMHFEELRVRRNLKSELGLQNRKIIAYFGRLSPEKYPEDVVRCAMKVVGSRSDVVFLLVGDGPMRTGLERLVSSMGLTNHVYILGFQPQERVRDLMYTADVILSPLTQVALIEATLSGTPVVAYDIEWHHELIKNERTGLLVPYRDYVEMAQAALWLLGHPEEARRLGERAREAALRQYDPKKMLRKEIDCFEGVLTNGREQSTWTSRESTHRVVQ
jgi:glycosyltransferase involved in cell wall biosynthesis